MKRTVITGMTEWERIGRKGKHEQGRWEGFGKVYSIYEIQPSL